MTSPATEKEAMIAQVQKGLADERELTYEERNQAQKTHFDGIIIADGQRICQTAVLTRDAELHERELLDSEMVTTELHSVDIDRLKARVHINELFKIYGTMVQITEHAPFHKDKELQEQYICLVAQGPALFVSGGPDSVDRIDLQQRLFMWLELHKQIQPSLSPIVVTQTTCIISITELVQMLTDVGVLEVTIFMYGQKTPISDPVIAQLMLCVRTSFINQFLLFSL
jgi:hypothetical protein